MATASPTGLKPRIVANGARVVPADLDGLRYDPADWPESARLVAHLFHQTHGYLPEDVIVEDHPEGLCVEVVGACENTGAPILLSDTYAVDEDGVTWITDEALAARLGASQTYQAAPLAEHYGLHPVRKLAPRWEEPSTIDQVTEWWANLGFEVQSGAVGDFWDDETEDVQDPDHYGNSRDIDPPETSWLRIEVWSNEDSETWATEVRPNTERGRFLVALADREWPAGYALGAAAPAYAAAPTTDTPE